MLIEDWPIDKVRPYAGNPRVNADIIERVAESIQAFGWQQPLVVDATGELVIGHARLQAAKLLGLEVVPVHVADLPEDRILALRIADNRTREFAEWDLSLLRDQLRGLDGKLLALAGFDPADDLLQNGWTAKAITPLPTRDTTVAIMFSAEQWAAIGPAIEKARQFDESMSAGRALELICADALA